MKKLTRLFIVTTTIVFTFPAAAYTLQDDPGSTWGGDGSTTSSISDNVITYQGFYAQNLTPDARQLSFIVPFIWPRIGNGSDRFAMQWDNAINSWYTSNFNNTGTSLTVSLTSDTSSVSYVPMGTVADLTGVQQLPLTERSSPICAVNSRAGCACDRRCMPLVKFGS